MSKRTTATTPTAPPAAPDLFALAPSAALVRENADVPITALEGIAEHAPASLVASVRLLGVTTPITVTRRDLADGDVWVERYPIVDGRRRAAAARAAGIDTVPAIIIGSHGNSRYETALVSVLNIVRGDNVVDEARSLARLVADGVSEDAIVAAGVPRATLRNRLRLAAAPPAILDAVAARRCAPSSAVSIANMPPSPERDVLVERAAAGERITGEDVGKARQVERAERVADIPAPPIETLFDAPAAREAFDAERAVAVANLRRAAVDAKRSGLGLADLIAAFDAA